MNYWQPGVSPRNRIVQGDTLELCKQTPSDVIDMVITSPPYYMKRDYKVQGQIGSEPTYQEYLDNLIEIFREIKRILKPTGTCWVNLGDTYNTAKRGNTNGTYGKVIQKAGINDMDIQKPLQHEVPKKSLLGIPDRFKLRMIDELGFSCRSDIIWHKPNSMPESCKDRFPVDYERLFLFVKSEKYFFDMQYEPLAESTIKEIQKLYTGKATKDFASAGAQDASSVKARIVRGLRTKAGKPELDAQLENKHGKDLMRAYAEAREQHPFSLMMQALSVGLSTIHDIQDEKIKNALKLGWQPDKETYDHWYFVTRERKGWHNHEGDLEHGNSRKGRSDPQSNIPLYHPLGRAKRSVWKIPVRAFKGAHFAVFPEALLETPIKAGCPKIVCGVCGTPAINAYAEMRRATRPGRHKTGTAKSGTQDDPNASLHNSDLSKYRQQIVRVPEGLKIGCTCELTEAKPGLILDPFMGAGTTALMAKKLGRDFLGFELKQEYILIAQARLASAGFA